MDEEIKRVLQQSIRALRSAGGKEVKPVIVSIEKLIKKRRPIKRIKRA